MYKVILFIGLLLTTIGCGEKERMCEDEYLLPDINISEDVQSWIPYADINKLFFVSENSDTVVYTKSKDIYESFLEDGIGFCPYEDDNSKTRIQYNRDQYTFQFESGNASSLEFDYDCNYAIMIESANIEDTDTFYERIFITQNLNTPDSYQSGSYRLRLNRGSNFIEDGLSKGNLRTVMVGGKELKDVLTISVRINELNADKEFFYNQSSGLQNYYDANDVLWLLDKIE